MNTTATPPDMSREQKRELKQLCTRMRQIDRSLEKQANNATNAADKIERAHERERRALIRQCDWSLKRLDLKTKKEKRPEVQRLARIMAGRAPENKERAAIMRRIAILEGRLGS
jgi:hypothetical protein